MFEASAFGDLGMRMGWWLGPSLLVCFPFTEPGLSMNTTRTERTASGQQGDIR